MINYHFQCCRMLPAMSSVLSQEIGWEERLRNDLSCVEWDVKPQLHQSMPAMSLTHVCSAAATVWTLTLINLRISWVWII